MNLETQISANLLNQLNSDEILQILLPLNTEDILNFCSTSKKANEWCQDDQFWKLKYQHDFQDYTIKSDEITWKKSYFFKYNLFKVLNSPISAGFDHYGIIDNIGHLHMAGREWGGHLGKKDINELSKSRLISFPDKSQKVINVYAGIWMTGAVTDDGKAYAWGNDADGLISGDPHDITSPMRIQIPNGKKAIKIIVESDGFFVLLEGGDVYFTLYQSISKNHIHSKYMELNAIDISVGIYPEVLSIITKDHKLYMLGGIDQLFADMKCADNFVLVPSPSVKMVSIGRDFVILLSTDGQVYEWGKNENLKPRPELVKLPEKIVHIDTNGKVSAALSINGRLYIWGENPKWGVNEYSDAYIHNPIEISIGIPINFISLGGRVTVAVTNDGVVNFW